VPVRAVVGSLDPLKRTVDPLRGRLARLEVVEIAGADHMNALGQPEFLQAVEEFLARKPEPGKAAPSGSAKHRAQSADAGPFRFAARPTSPLCALRSEPERSDKRPDHR
jgi:hypothetical protein